MPERAFNLLLGLAGTVAVMAMVLWGADPAVGARTGSRWKRNLILVGLAYLALLGLSFLLRKEIRDWLSEQRRMQSDCYAKVRVDEPETTVDRLGTQLHALRGIQIRSSIAPETLRRATTSILAGLDKLEHDLGGKKSDRYQWVRIERLRGEAHELLAGIVNSPQKRP